MGCSTCQTNSETAGCQSNGHCASGGCNKLNVYDWLSDMDVPMAQKFDVMEIRFKNGRKEFFRNTEKLPIITGDAVVVDVPNGHDVGYISLQGELVRLQMSKKGVKNNDKIRNIYRKATAKDIERWQEAQNREPSVIYRTKEIIQNMKLEMKLTDVEFQADGSKAIFYYSAEGRVDFRELIKILATEFKIRIEMKQISLRQEASRIGGIGVCGRELCCSTWLTSFKNVTTSAARYQNLSVNPSKLSGQCGRLKCCLNYELDTYMDALKHIPKMEKPLQTEMGDARLQKTDIFRKKMWFSFKNDDTWHPIGTDRVKEILEMNKAGKKPATLLIDELEEEKVESNSINSDLEAMDKKFRKKNKKKSRNYNKNRKNRNRNKKPQNQNKQQ